MTDEVQKKEREKEEDTSFTVDSEISRTVEVPSINKLLNRKTLVGYLRQNEASKQTKVPVSTTEGPPEPALQRAQPTDTTLRNSRSEEPLGTLADLKVARHSARPELDDQEDQLPEADHPDSNGNDDLQLEYDHGNSDPGNSPVGIDQPTGAHSQRSQSDVGQPQLPTQAGLRNSSVNLAQQPTNASLRNSQVNVAQGTNSRLRNPSANADQPTNSGSRLPQDSGQPTNAELVDSQISFRSSAQLSTQTSSQISSKTQVFRAPSRGATGTLSSTPKLIVWTLDKLRSSVEPIQQGISVMFQKGTASALFLTIHPPQPGSPLPHFIGYATVGSVAKESIWTGLQWNPVSVPKIWNQFVREGYIELPPSANREYNHPNLVRAAYGVSPNEWLLLARVGTEKACRGIIAFVSKETMTPYLRTVLPMLATSRSRGKKS